MSTTGYPVHYTIEPPGHCSRLQLAARVLAFCALGLLGISFGTLFAVAFLALPVYAASRLSGGRSPDRYLAEDGSRIVRGLRWWAAISAWAGLVAEQLPARTPDEVVRLEVEPSGARPTPGGVLVRVLTGLPSALVLALLAWIGGLVWLWAALTILIGERIGDGAFRYLAGLQRWSVRLLAYQAGLVDAYPPFGFAEAPPPALPTARAMS